MEGSQKVTIPTLMSLLPADAVSLFFRPSVCNNNNSDSFPSNAWGKRENFAFCGPFAHCTVIVRKYCCTVWPEPIWIKVSGWWQIPPQHQRRPRISINWNPHFQTSLHKISKEVCFRLISFFFRNKKSLSKEQLLFGFLSIVKRKKISERSEIFWNFLFFENYFIKMV